MEQRPDIGHHAELCQELDRSAWRRGEAFRCVCGQELREKEALMSDEDKQRLARTRAVSRDFFKDKPPGTTIKQDELEAYWARLREVAEETR